MVKTKTVRNAQLSSFFTVKMQLLLIIYKASELNSVLQKL